MTPIDRFARRCPRTADFAAYVLYAWAGFTIASMALSPFWEFAGDTLENLTSLDGLLSIVPFWWLPWKLDRFLDRKFKEHGL